MAANKGQIDFFDFLSEVNDKQSSEQNIKNVEEVKKIELRIPPSLHCPECDLSLRLRRINGRDKDDKRRAWYCPDCGQQTVDEYGRR